MYEAVERAVRSVVLQRLQEVHILEKSRARAFVKKFRHPLVFEVEVPREAEHVVAGVFRFGCEQVSRPNRYALASVALRRSRSGLGATDVQIDDAGRMPSRNLPAVDIALEVSGVSE